MRAYFPDITADTPEQAVHIADAKSATEAKYVDDCDGTTLAALVDHDGDDEYYQSQIIELDLPKSLANDLLRALEVLLDTGTPDIGRNGECRHCHRRYAPQDHPLLLGLCPSDTCAGFKARDVIARATPTPAVAPAKRITATFIPQAWINDYAVVVDPVGDTQFDVTECVIALGKTRALALQDDQHDSDTLREAPSAPQWIKDWSGPFAIAVQDSIAAYYAE
jgi:hypothetical protein